MMKTPRSLLTLSVTAFLLACGGNPPPDAPEADEVDAVAVDPAPTDQVLSDERAMEIGRDYVEALQARDFERLWQHVTPESKQRFGTVERFRTEGSAVLDELGAELGVMSEDVEPARAGMMADKLYLRVSTYAGSEGDPVRLMIGLANDGSIVGVQFRRAD